MSYAKKKRVELIVFAPHDPRALGADANTFFKYRASCLLCPLPNARPRGSFDTVDVADCRNLGST